MKGKLVIMLLISLFSGFVCVGTAIGVLLPSIFQVSAPLVCQGQMVVEVRQYSVRPGEHSTQNTIYCIHETTGEKRDISFLAIVVSCLIFSGIIFLLLTAGMLVKRLRGKTPEEPPAAVSPPTTTQTPPLP